MRRSFLAPPLFLALTLVLPGCTCEEPTPAAPPAPSATATSSPVCPSLPPVGAWQPVGAEFFEARLPASFREAKIEEGRGFRDDAGKRRIQFSPIDLPLGGMDVTAAIDKLNEGVRGQASAPELQLKLGRVRHGGTAAEPLRYYLVTSPERIFVQGLVGRAMPDGRLHAVLIIFEHEELERGCMQDHAKALMETVSIPPGAAAAASGSAGPLAPPPPVRFTTRATTELRRQVRPGETVWVGVTREGSEISYVLDVGERVPPNADVVQVGGVPVAVDRASRPLLEGVQVDFVPDSGFVFRAPNESP